jgi:phage terminase large subunit
MKKPPCQDCLCLAACKNKTLDNLFDQCIKACNFLNSKKTKVSLESRITLMLKILRPDFYPTKHD